MAYQGNLGDGRTLFVENNGDQTDITLQSSSAGQQQSQGTAFTTGAWKEDPTVNKTPQGAILEVQGSRGHFRFQIEGNSVRALSGDSSQGAGETVPLSKGEAPSHQPMKPMEPMQSMKPMEPMKPMEMKLGNMHMKMGGSAEESESESGETAKADANAASKSESRFCTQCGNAAEADDKFCGKCGQKLRV